LFVIWLISEGSFSTYSTL